MFSRFSVQARLALFHARTAVSQFGSAAIEPEHLLLGLLHEGSGLGCQFIARSGRIDDLRRDIVTRLAGGATTAEHDEIPFSAASMHALTGAIDEADRLAHDAIGTEHLLLGLLRVEHGVAAEALAARGLRIDTVRAAILEERGDALPFEVPGPPPTPANTYQWPHIPFVPSRTVHILYSGMQWPEPPVINHAGGAFSAFGFTLEDAIVRAWDGNRWHVDLSAAAVDDTRYDFLMTLPAEETTAACLGLLRSAVEEHFGLAVTTEPRQRDVLVLTRVGDGGRMLRRYPDPEPGTGMGLLSFSTFIRRSPDQPLFPLAPFTVHSVPFFLLVRWFEEMLGKEVMDDARLSGIYRFELTHRVDTPEAFVARLREDAGLSVALQRRERSMLVVQRRFS